MPGRAPAIKTLTRAQVFRSTTTSPHTKTLDHLRTFPRAWLKRSSHKDPHMSTVRPADRISWWNIVPGDKIGLRGDKDGVIHDVLSVNKLSNRVFLAGAAGVSVWFHDGILAMIWFADVGRRV
jgi:hypothetical protein